MFKIQSRDLSFQDSHSTVLEEENPLAELARAVLETSSQQLRQDPSPALQFLDFLVGSGSDAVDRKTQALFFQKVREAHCLNDEEQLNQWLCDAIEASDLPLVKELLNLNAPLDSLENSYSSSALYLAARKEQKEIRSLLLKAGADPNIASLDGETPLHEATKRDDIPWIEELIEAKADMNMQNADGETPLITAHKRGNMLAVSTLLARGADPKIADYSGYFMDESELHTLLLIAQSMGNHALIQALVHKEGMSVQVGEDFLTPFIEATLRGSKEKIRDLNPYVTAAEWAFIRKNSVINALGLPNQTYFEGRLIKNSGSFMPMFFKKIAASLAHFSDTQSAQIPLIREAFEQAAHQRSNQEILDAARDAPYAILEAGKKGHAIGLVIMGNEKRSYLGICNRGEGVNQNKHTIFLYRIDRSKFSQEVIQRIQKTTLEEESVDQAVEFYYQTLPALLSPVASGKPAQDGFCSAISKLNPTLQKYNNCAFTSSMAALYCCLMGAASEGLGFPAQIPAEVQQQIIETNKWYSTRVKYAAYSEFMQEEALEPPHNRDERLMKFAKEKMEKTFRTRGLTPEMLKNR